MTLNSYQQQALTTAQCPVIGHPVVYPVMGLCGEAGEVMEKVKKAFRDCGGTFDTERTMGILTELGDALWYIAVAADRLGYDLDDVAEINLAKLRDRRARQKIQGDGDDR